MAISIPGYQTSVQIYESANSLVYRSRREGDDRAAILKVLKEDYPSPGELARYKQEYEITRSLDIEGVVKAYDLQKYQNTLVMILEDFGGESLKFLMARQKFTLAAFLDIAIKIARCLGQVHAANIIHKDINPANIVFNPESQQVKLIDFGISTALSRENPTFKHPLVLEGTLNYISPEQTGRMNRALDYRTDLYSLGVTFYELLTGQLPFIAEDSMELVHCHIAKQPVPPCEINPDIPPPLSSIVMKLLAKTAEERYQSAWGIKADLETCQQQLNASAIISNFSLGCQDVSDHFHIPQKLYGRQREIDILLAAFERVSGWSLAENQTANQVEMMLVAGYSGIGKSALVQEIFKPLTQKRGYFIAGKFDQFQRNIPYSAVVKAFQSLIRQLLTESEAQLNRWREKILTAFGTNGQVIIEVIPEVELIVGEQPAVATLTPSESKNRFNSVFQRFIRVFCQPQHPLVIFLDDLQWADSATLKLIELMMADEETQHLFLMGAYRDNEVSATHPLIMTVDALEKQGAIINTITLKPLQIEHIIELIGDTLQQEENTVKPLADLVVRKTNGNPFFVNQFLKTLHRENAIAFDIDRGGWRWDISQIEAMEITDNVVDLTISNLKKLPISTQQVLRLAACVGNQFDLHTLTIVYEKSSPQTFQDLLPAIQLGLILPTSDLELTKDEEIIKASLAIANYKFLHDRVQQAAYALIDDERKQAVHLQIGRLLLENISAEEREERLFELVDHLNVGRQLIADENQRVELTYLNLEAAQKAKDATAYSAALQYLIAGLDDRGEILWKSHYDLALKLYTERAAIEYLNGSFETSESFINQTVERVKTPIEKAEVYYILIVQYTLRAKYAEAIEIGRKALSLIDIDLPESDLETARDAEMAAVTQLIGERAIASLFDLPEMERPDKKVAMKLLTSMGPPTYRSHQKLWSVIVSKAVNLCLQYGNVPQTAYSHTSYGGLLGYVRNDYQSGEAFGKLALKLSQKFNNPSDKSVAYLMIGSSLKHWSQHLKSASQDYLEAYNVGLESGNLQYAAYAFGHNMYCRFYQGVNLDKLLTEISGYLSFSKHRKNQWAIDLLEGGQLLICNLIGKTDGIDDFRNESISEVSYLERCRANKNIQVLCIYNILKMQVLYLYNRPAEALQCYREADDTIIFVATQGLLPSAEYKFTHSLILAGLYADASASEKRNYWQELVANQRQLKIWADTCPENFAHQYFLVAAEMARLCGNDGEAIELYDRAIESAKQYEFVQDTAIANELAAKFWLAKGKESYAKIHMEQAHYCYLLWGAQRKVEELERDYPQLILKMQTAVSIDKTLAHSNTTTQGSTKRRPSLDLATVMKASQAISGEILLANLLDKLMKIAIENAGAQFGYLILEREGTLVIEAAGAVEGKQIAVPQSTPVENCNYLPVSIVNYVARTQENVVLSNAVDESTFAADTYIESRQPKSVLCAPIVNHTQLVGIVYLENDLTTGAFTRDRLEILSLLCSQAAISIENARLYEQSRDYSQKLEQSLQQLQDAQLQLVQSEKMCSLGQLAAGVAHEINNPVGFIANNIKYVSQYTRDIVEHLQRYQQQFPNPGQEICEDAEDIDLEYILEDLPKTILSMKEGTDRIRHISVSMRTFSRADTAKKVPFNIHEGIDSTLMILKHKLKANENRPEIEIVKEYGDLPDVNCYPGQLNQVFMNLIANAIDALEEYNEFRTYDEVRANPCQIAISTEMAADKDCVMIRIKDNGPGMSEEVKQKVFDHLYTTKPVGKGTGLGLSISRQIVVEKHGGTLRCISEPGKGAEFAIALPL